MQRQTRLMTVFTFTLPLGNTWYALLNKYLKTYFEHRHQFLARDCWIGGTGWGCLLENECYCEVLTKIFCVEVFSKRTLSERQIEWMWKSLHLHSKLETGVGGGEGTFQTYWSEAKTIPLWGWNIISNNLTNTQEYLVRFSNSTESIWEPDTWRPSHSGGEEKIQKICMAHNNVWMLQW